MGSVSLHIYTQPQILELYVYRPSVSVPWLFDDGLSTTEGILTFTFEKIMPQRISLLYFCPLIIFLKMINVKV